MQTIQKAYEITDAKISFVSLVDKAANKRRFLMTKAKDGKASFTTYGRIIRKDSENHYITGIVYEPMEEDSHGNYMTAVEITKAAYWFAKNGDKVDLQHSFEPLENAVVVENWVTKSDCVISGEDIKEGTWLMTVEVSDEDVWKNIENGSITGFSMGGLGDYSEEDVKLDNISKTSEKKSLLKQLASALGLSISGKEDIETVNTSHPVTKAGKKMSSKNKEALQCIYDNLGTFLAEFDESSDTPQKIAPEDEQKSENEKEEKEVTKNELEEIITKSVESAIAKTMGISSADDEKKEDNSTTDEANEIKADSSAETPETGKSGETLTPEKIEEMVTAAVEKILGNRSEEPNTEQVQKMIDTAIEKALDPVLKSKGLPSNISGTVEKSAEHYLHGIL